MPSGTGLAKFQKFFPERMFDVGIAEQHAVTFAAGMAKDGWKPFVAIYSTFLQRAYDQIVHDVCIQSLPVRFVIDRAGFVGEDGATHNGVFDLAYLSSIPNIVIMAPSDEVELAKMVKTAYLISDRPSSIGFPKGSTKKVGQLPAVTESLSIGKGRILKEGMQVYRKGRVAFLSLGSLLHEVLEAASIMEKQEGVHVSVADARFVKPIDFSLIDSLASTHDILITVEEGVTGGFGSQVVQYLLSNGKMDKGELKFRSIVIPDKFFEQSTMNDLRAQAKIDALSIVNFTCNLMSEL